MGTMSLYDIEDEMIRERQTARKREAKAEKLKQQRDKEYELGKKKCLKNDLLCLEKIEDSFEEFNRMFSRIINREILPTKRRKTFLELFSRSSIIDKKHIPTLEVSFKPFKIMGNYRNEIRIYTLCEDLWFTAMHYDYSDYSVERGRGSGPVYSDKVEVTSSFSMHNFEINTARKWLEKQYEKYYQVLKKKYPKLEVIV